MVRARVDIAYGGPMPTETEVVDPLALDRQVCFALAVTNRAVLSVYRPLLEPMGLTHPQYLVMLALWEQSPRTVKGIAEALQLDSPTLSPLLKRLEATGMLIRSRSATDERVLEVHLSDEGAALRSRAEAIPGAVVGRLGVDLAELEHLRVALARINASAVSAGALKP